MTRTILRRAATLLTALVLLRLASCSPNEPDTNGFDAAALVAGDVVDANLMPWVRQLAAAHASDTPVDSSGYTVKDLFPAGSLTRDSAVRLVSNALRAMGYEPNTLVLGEGTQAAHNVVAEWPGTTRASEVVLVGCHLDAFYAGADDNSSGVAAMLEIARVVRGRRFARTIRFAAFDLEEFGSVGSTRYIKAGYARDVAAAIVLETIGYASSEPGSQDGILSVELPDVGDFLLVVGNEASASLAQRMVALGNTRSLAKLHGVVAPGDGTFFLSSAFMRSDHGLLWYSGIPALLLTDTANLRNPNYHKTTDTPETLDPAFLAANTRAAAGAVALFAEVQQ